jgi:hypothetical protein
MTFTAGTSYKTSTSIAVQRFYEFLARNSDNMPRALGEPDAIGTGDTTTRPRS